MSEITPFEFPDTGQQVRTGIKNGEPLFTVADVCKILGIGNPSDAARRIHPDDLDTIEVIDSLGRTQNATAVTESGLYDLILDSRKPEARAFRRWITAEVIPSIRKTGSYSATAREITRRDLAQMVIAEADRADQAEARAEVAEGTVREIEAGAGLTIRAFHKKYFSDVAEREFFEHLYAKKYLIDQRKKGSLRADGTARDGSEHRHPAAKGKPYLYLHFGGMHGNHRRENTRVRPGQPELDLKAALVKDGLKANENGDGFLFAIEGGA